MYPFLLDWTRTVYFDLFKKKPFKTMGNSEVLDHCSQALGY